jgi:L-lactate dehydrogenase
MKVTIIGGGGRVGSNAAFALQCAGLVSEIQILDANQDLAEGEALDLLHGASSIADQRIYAGDYARAKDSDIFVITAGLRRKPDESRLDLINRNVALFGQILEGIRQAGHRPDALVFVVSNPVDILTQLAAARLKLPWSQVLGLGTMLDTARFRSLIAQDLKLAPTQVKATILGEHGDSMVPIWSSAAYAGMPLVKVPGCTPTFQSQIFERTKGSGAEVIRRKGGAGWAVGLTIAEVVHAIALDRRQTLPVSTVQQGAYGLRNVALSVPTVVGRAGALSHLEVELWPKEAQALQASARALQETYAKVAKAATA